MIGGAVVGEKQTATVVIEGRIVPPFSDFHEFVLREADLPDAIDGAPWVADFPTAITDDAGEAVGDVWGFRVYWYEDETP